MCVDRRESPYYLAICSEATDDASLRRPPPPTPCGVLPLHAPVNGSFHVSPEGHFSFEPEACTLRRLTGQQVPHPRNK
jgi:hypothetical protein